MNLDYAAGQIAAAFKMAFNRPGWSDALDHSVDGVFRSFYAIIFTAPFAILGFFFLRRAASRTPEFPAAQLLEAPIGFALAFQMTGFLVDWAASLAALVVAARYVGASKSAANLIAGFNWTQVIVAVTQTAPIAALSLPGGRQFASLLFLPATAFVIALYWGILRRGLNTGVVSTILMIVVLTLIGLIASSVIGSIAAAVLHALA